MLLLVGLGNPGIKYSNNRHNVGYMVIDYLVDCYNLTNFRSKFSGLINNVIIKDQKILIFKPLNYMNNSGVAIRDVVKFYNIDLDDVIVFHDDLDLALAQIKVKKAGGSGGHNGIKSIDQSIGNQYWRVRIGIEHPGDKNLVAHYVLSDFTIEQKLAITKKIQLIAENIESLLLKDFDGFLSSLKIK